ncbi:MAG: DeoR/GlpR family DNA-binding transcription regulator [Eubacteriales bacterium]|nr:DeoR/GlpR family DNA-binding transcription regulator [Eubacteriales bacterium]
MKISRLNSIEEYVLSKKTVSIDELCEVFQVSKNTIRRDLNELEERGHIAKVYGGVTAVTPEEVMPLPVRSGLNPSAKNRIGQLAAREIRDGDTIFIDSGSTAVNVLRHLPLRIKVTVVTHSLPAMMEAAKFDNISLISLGGVYNPSTSSFVGIAAQQALSDLRISKAFLSATGVTVESGMSNTTFLEAEIKRGVVAHTSHVILIADNSKLGHDATVTFCRLRDISTFITDQQPAPKFTEFCRAHSIRLVWE